MAARAWIPRDLPGCVLWLRSDLGVTKDGSNNVTQWADQSGQGNHAAPGTAPLYVASGVNGKPVIRFDDTSSQFLSITGNSTLWPQKLTLVAVSKTTHLASSAEPGIVAISLSQYAITHYQGDSHIYSYLGSSGNSNGATVALNGWAMPMLSWDGTTGANGYRLYNGSTLLGQKASSQASYTASGDVHIGQRPTPYYWGGDLAEVVLVNRDLSAAERAWLVSYVNVRYALSL